MEAVVPTTSYATVAPTVARPVTPAWLRRMKLGSKTVIRRKADRGFKSLPLRSCGQRCLTPPVSDTLRSESGAEVEARAPRGAAEARLPLEVAPRATRVDRVHRRAAGAVDGEGEDERPAVAAPFEVCLDPVLPAR